MSNFKIITGYIPGIIGRVTQLHADYYSKQWNFSQYFEAKVASELSNFICNLNENDDCVWSLVKNGIIEGSITIDSSSENRNTAHLRWFIVSEDLEGCGAGNILMEKAMSFCTLKEFYRVYLWTFQGLETARHLYEKYGFNLTEESKGNQWGTSVIEQKFEVSI